MNTAQKWISICFINLLIVALLGVTLRYKIAFSLPFVDQKHLLHGHSHFAFAGWITQFLMVLMVHQLAGYTKQDEFKKYNYLLWGNLITAYGMLVAFPIQGYGLFSISFSTLSIINGYVFGYQYWRAIHKTQFNLNSFRWFKSGIVFNVISSIGAFTLAYLMATKSVSQTAYLLSVYGFLHFQYNGWFFFAIVGLLIGRFELDTKKNKSTLHKIYWVFSIACVPAYFLSALWLNMPTFLYMIVIIAAIAQCIAWVYLFLEIKRAQLFNRSVHSIIGKWILTLSAISLTIKLLLQLLSTLPGLSNIAFGFRPIIIGYLHLMLLGVISLFIIGFTVKTGLLKITQSIKWGLSLFIIGVIVNQLFLMLQGLYAMQYTGMPNIAIFLLGAAMLMFTGLVFLNYGIIKNGADK